MPFRARIHRPAFAKERKPWAKRPDAPKRLTGRRLQARNAQLKSDAGYYCAQCGKLTTQLEVDHVTPLCQGGADERHNLQVLCADGPNSCHVAKSQQERLAASKSDAQRQLMHR